MKHKKLRVVSVLLCFVLILCMLAGCGKDKEEEFIEATPTPRPTSTPVPITTPEPTPEVRLALTEDDIKDYITMQDLYVQQNSENVNWLLGMNPDSSVIASIEVDDSNVDLTRVGKYRLSYTITINKNIYMEREGIVADTSSAASGEEEQTVKAPKRDEQGRIVIESEYITVKVDKYATVISSEDAQSYLRNGELVLGSNGSSIKLVEVTPTPEPTATPTPTPAPTSTPAPTAPPRNTHTVTTTPTPRIVATPVPTAPPNPSNSNADSGLPLPSKSDEHRHKWVTIHMVTTPEISHTEDIYETRTNSEAYDETIHTYKCNDCGSVYTSEADAISHINGKNHSGYTDQGTKTVHHEAGTEQVWMGSVTVYDQREVSEDVTYCADPTCPEYNAAAAEYARNR